MKKSTAAKLNVRESLLTLIESCDKLIIISYSTDKKPEFKRGFDEFKGVLKEHERKWKLSSMDRPSGVHDEFLAYVGSGCTKGLSHLGCAPNVRSLELCRQELRMMLEQFEGEVATIARNASIRLQVITESLATLAKELSDIQNAGFHAHRNRTK